MRFQVNPLQEFLVRPALPAALPRLSELAYNVLWSWDHTIRALFRRLDPQLWIASGHNPILLLSQIPQSTLQRAASDPRYLSLYRRACERLDGYLANYESTKKEGFIAYFCMEFGVVQCLPIYSGGLGILAGDHLKSASDLGLPLVAVGLLYREGYFKQYLNADGWQQELYPRNDFYNMEIGIVPDETGKQLTIDVEYPERIVKARIWRCQVGRVPLFLLDSDFDANNEDDREITARLYQGDRDMRIRHVSGHLGGSVTAIDHDCIAALDQTRGQPADLFFLRGQ